MRSRVGQIPITSRRKVPQRSINVENPINHQAGIKAAGTIRGRDKDTILGIKNCPGGGHGELKLHVTWTEDEQ